MDCFCLVHDSAGATPTSDNNRLENRNNQSHSALTDQQGDIKNNEGSYERTYRHPFF